MINLKEQVREFDGIEYVPLIVAQQAVDEAYEFQKYQAKLDDALQTFNKAMNDLNTTVEDINKND